VLFWHPTEPSLLRDQRQLPGRCRELQNQGHITEAHQIESSVGRASKDRGSKRTSGIPPGPSVPNRGFGGSRRGGYRLFPPLVSSPTNPSIMLIANLLNDSWQKFLKETAAYRGRPRSDWQPEISVATGVVELISAATQRSSDGGPQPAAQRDDRQHRTIVEPAGAGRLLAEPRSVSSFDKPSKIGELAQWGAPLVCRDLATPDRCLRGAPSGRDLTPR
jgi:hypothetical protein